MAEEQDRNTTTSCNGQSITLPDLIKLVRRCPKPSKVYAVEYKILFSDVLPPTAIIISRDLANKLEELGIISFGASNG